MKNYLIEVTETCQRSFVVRAESTEQAIRRVTDAAENGEFELSFDDFTGRDVAVNEEYAPDGTIPENMICLFDELKPQEQ